VEIPPPRLRAVRHHRTTALINVGRKRLAAPGATVLDSLANSFLFGLDLRAQPAVVGGRVEVVH